MRSVALRTLVILRRLWSWFTLTRITSSSYPWLSVKPISHKREFINRVDQPLSLSLHNNKAIKVHLKVTQSTMVCPALNKILMKAQRAGQATLWCSSSVLEQFSSWRITSSARRNKSARKATTYSNVKESTDLKSTSHQSVDQMESWTTGTPSTVRNWVSLASSLKTACKTSSSSSSSSRTADNAPSLVNTWTTSSTGVLRATRAKISLAQATTVVMVAACGTTTSDVHAS